MRARLDLVNMTTSQAQRLYVLVRETRTLNYEIPQGRLLAALLYPGKKIGESQVRAATGVVQRLREHGCIRKQGNRQFIDEHRLVTERASANYVLKFREHCLASPDGTIDKQTFHQRLLGDPLIGFDGGTLDEVYGRAIAGKYFVEIHTSKALRVGGHLTDQLMYLQLLQSDSTK